MSYKFKRSHSRYQQALAETIQELRRAHNHTQETLAAASGINRTHLGRMEAINANPKFTTLITLCSALDVTLTDLAHRIEVAVTRKDR